MNSPAVYLTTRALYSDRHRYKTQDTGFWVDPTRVDYGDILLDLTEAQGKHCPADIDVCPMATDYEGFPECLYSENYTEASHDAINAWDALSDEEKLNYFYLRTQCSESHNGAMRRTSDVWVSKGTAVDAAREY